MKKTILLSLFAMATLCVSAQEKKQECTQDCAAKKAACVEACAEKLAADLCLNDKTKAQFTAVYKEYSEALAKAKEGMCDKACKECKCGKDCKCKDGKGATDCKCGKDCKCSKGCKAGKCTKALTDEEAKAKLDKKIEKAERRIAMQQKCLAVQKAYKDKFLKVLTPQQTLRVMKFDCNKCCKQGKCGKQGKFGKQGKGFQRNGFKDFDGKCQMMPQNGRPMMRQQACPQGKACPQGTTCPESQPKPQN